MASISTKVMLDAKRDKLSKARLPVPANRSRTDASFKSVSSAPKILKIASLSLPVEGLYVAFFNVGRALPFNFPDIIFIVYSYQARRRSEHRHPKPSKPNVTPSEIAGGNFSIPIISAINTFDPIKISTAAKANFK